jgi:hypothetical protein
MRDQPLEACSMIDHDVIRNAFDKHNGDFREALMTLYDLFERWARSREPRLAGSQQSADRRP